jgi:hypothetical protein
MKGDNIRAMSIRKREIMPAQYLKNVSRWRLLCFAQRSGPGNVVLDALHMRLPAGWEVIQTRSPPQAPTRRPRCLLTHNGTVRSAAEPCRLSSVSPPRNSSSDLRLISAGAPHESTSPASNLAPAPARTLVLCLAFGGTQ